MKDLLLKTAKFGLDDLLKRFFFFTINLLGLLRIFINFLKLKIKINQNEINETHKKQSSWHPSNSLIVFALDRKCSIFQTLPLLRLFPRWVVCKISQHFPTKGSDKTIKPNYQTQKIRNLSCGYYYKPFCSFCFISLYLMLYHLLISSLPPVNYRDNLI